MRFKDMKISTKLYLGFSVPVILMLVIIAIGMAKMAVMESSISHIVTINNARANLTNDMGTIVREDSISMRNLILAQDIKDKESEQNDIRDARTKYDEMLTKFMDLTRREDTKGWELIDKIKTAQDIARKLNNQVLELAMAGKDSDALSLMTTRAKPATRSWIKALDDANNYQDEVSMSRYQEMKKAYADAHLLMIITGLITILLAGGIAFFITRGISGSLTRVIHGLSEAADQVASAASQVSAASQSLAEGSSQQAASVEETSASLEEMSSMTKRNATSAGQANSLMKQANQVVGKANVSMIELTTSMQEISKASEETSKIIKTIDEIAFQTNLLALNAAVEAARAGEAGAGFAVVADEVRNLAMRAADAAKNTAVLIESTVKKISDGTCLVQTTNDAFEEVAESAGKVGQLVGDIAAASSEQAQGIEQVNIAVTEMDKVTQQNAANAEESASASEELNAQAEEMKTFVQELVKLVGGNGSVATSNSQILKHPKRIVTPQKTYQRRLPITEKPVRIGRLIQRSEVKPQEVIPMDEAELNNF